MSMRVFKFRRQVLQYPYIVFVYVPHFLCFFSESIQLCVGCELEKCFLFFVSKDQVFSIQVINALIVAEVTYQYPCIT